MIGEGELRIEPDPARHKRGRAVRQTRRIGIFMHIGFFLKGLIIGISIAAPVGPIGVLCVQRTLAAGRLHGFISGLGAATADAVYGLIAGFGLTLVSNFMVAQQMWFRLVGGAFLLYLGVKGFLSTPSTNPGPLPKTPSRTRAFGSTLFLTLANPMTIIAFAAIFAGLGLVRTETNYLSAALLVTGVFLGSALWWLILSCVTGMLREKISHRGLRRVNRLAGVVITSFGLLAILSLTL